ncbi:MAG TPA: hypothetical protein VGA20_09415 [Gemmatimonadales bacterium]
MRTVVDVFMVGARLVPAREDKPAAIYGHLGTPDGQLLEFRADPANGGKGIERVEPSSWLEVTGTVQAPFVDGSTRGRKPLVLSVESYKPGKRPGG